MVRRTAILAALAGLVWGCDTNPSLHAAALAPDAPAKLDLALEPLAVDACTEAVVSAHPGEAVSLCARVTSLVKHGKGKNAKTVKTAKKGEAVVFHLPMGSGILGGDAPDLMATTDAAGEARLVYTAGSVIGQQTLLATTASGAQLEIDVMVSEPVPIAAVGQPHPDTAYPVSRDLLGGLSERVFGKSVTGVR